MKKRQFLFTDQDLESYLLGKMCGYENKLRQGPREKHSVPPKDPDAA